MLRDIAALFIDPIMRIWTAFVNYIPAIVAALLFIVFGLFIARLLSSLLEQFLKKIKLDSLKNWFPIKNLS